MILGEKTSCVCFYTRYVHAQMCTHTHTHTPHTLTMTTRELSRFSTGVDPAVSANVLFDIRVPKKTISCSLCLGK